MKPDEFTPKGMEIAQRLCYVSGCILTAGKRQKQTCIVAIRTLLSGKKYSIPDSMPTQLVDEAQCFEGGLVYPKESFFSFMFYLEEISRIVLQHQNIVLFGNKLFQELRSILLHCKELQAVF